MARDRAIDCGRQVARKSHMSTPESVVQRQLEAYNARDLSAWLATYAPDAEQYELHGARLAAGHAQMRERMAARFAEPDLHAELLSRVVMGPVVVDHERVTRNFPEGKGTIEMLCVYEVVNGVIARASFALGAKLVRGHAPRRRRNA
jgi:putative hydrolase of HD superfamily